MVIEELGENHYPAWEKLLYSLNSGAIAFNHVYGKSKCEHKKNTLMKPTSSIKPWPASAAWPRPRWWKHTISQPARELWMWAGAKAAFAPLS